MIRFMSLFRHSVWGPRPTSLLLLAVLCGPHLGLALSEGGYFEEKPSPGSFAIVRNREVATLHVDAGDHAGVIRAAKDLAADIERVTGCAPKVSTEEPIAGGQVIIVGTLGKSPALDRMVREGKLDTAGLKGQWESFVIQVVPHPLPGVEQALVIAGSDKRGTIYGVYDLSEQIGVSPWYWWADVPAKRRAELFVKPGRYAQGPPAVKYRGIFLNDEAPALTGWTKEKFGGYNHSFYTNVFELLLRLKANYLWPAMWDNCFNEDDPLNPKLADEYGIVMGTSHVEPMMRADKEWNRKGFGPAQWNYATHSAELRAFWTEGLARNRAYENLVTIAMRGKIDTPMSETANIALLEHIVSDQRQIIAEVMQTNAAAVPQIWALYKEVQEYYEKGMRVPDDVTLLWCDDNWGNVRRLPTPEERGRSGGAGIYYHFDYVGDPRNYKWLNTVPITKVWEQMNLAYQYGADRVWIVNVGDLKPMEFPMEFFLTLAWQPAKWPNDRLAEYGRLWAEREFGPRYAAQAADVVSKYTKYNGRRKPELLEPGTYSLVNYQEADRVLAEWKAIVDEAESVYGQLPEEYRDAFYELVLHPAKACAIVNELYITTAKNRLYARQGRAGANAWAAKARELFREDARLSDYFNHTLARGKWSHMMDQTHIGYTYWQEPPSNAMPSVAELEVPMAARPAVAVEGSESAWPGGAGEAVLPAIDRFNRQRRFIDVFNRGQTPFGFSATTSAPWLVLDCASGTVDQEVRLWASVDWSKAPQGTTRGYVKIIAAQINPISIGVDVFNPKEPTDAKHCFTETEGYVAAEAEHYTKKVDAGPVHWERIADYGRTLSSMTIMPVTSKSAVPGKDSPRLEYEMYLFHSGEVQVESVLAPTLNFVPGRGLRFAVSFDDQPPQIVDALARNSRQDWEIAVKDSVRKVRSTHKLDSPGPHTLKIWMVDPGIVLQRVVVDLGGVKPSYFGPLESFCQQAKTARN
jgi:Glycosyl hydrolase family 115/Gylcosyl hydrolase family 115 C-terminal domain